MQNLKTEQEIMHNWRSNIANPVVSICCITYNHQDFITQTLDGFLIQETDFPFDILIYDDASTDNNQKIIKSYEEKYPQIIKPIYSKKNNFSKKIRVNPTFNFTRAKGNYIAICEGDDFWTDKHKLQIQYDFLEANKEYVICYTDIIPFDNNKELDINFGGARKDLTKEELLFCTPIYTLTVMFRHVLQNGLPSEARLSIYGDLFIWSMLSHYGKGKFISQIKPSKYRVHNNGIHSKLSLRKKELNVLTLYLALCLYYFRSLKFKISWSFVAKFVKLCRESTTLFNRR